MSELRRLPKVDVLASHPDLSVYPEPVRVRAARKAIESVRAELLGGGAFSEPELVLQAVCEAEREATGSIRRVINASGVILHTGLGRARLSREAARAIGEAATHHSAVEFNLEDGLRGDRQDHVRDLLCELTGAADALVVNNCAAAVFLALNAHCAGREVILSRGQMVEIGGSFRMPDIVRQSGCELVEAGCTNKTHLRDYSDAITDRTAAILRCHPSNFRLVGFVEEPASEELAALAHERGLLLIDDVGSGTVVDTSAFGLPKEPTLHDSLAAGADLVLSSGDKMLGATQAGIMLGSAVAIRSCKRHPLARAMRVDKLTLAGLEATLRLHVQGRQSEIPTLWAMSRPLADVRRAALRIAKARSGLLVEKGLTEVGGGSIPGTGIATWRVGLKSPNADALARSLRKASPPIVGRIERDLVWLDPRTMDETDVRDAVRVLKGLQT